jgi:hypothetical protein
MSYTTTTHKSTKKKHPANQNVELVNPEQLIYTLDKKKKLEMELTVRVGHGYCQNDENKKPGQPPGKNCPPNPPSPGDTITPTSQPESHHDRPRASLPGTNAHTARIARKMQCGPNKALNGSFRDSSAILPCSGSTTSCPLLPV